METLETREIARHLAEAARHFPLLGPWAEEGGAGLLALVRAELGDEGRLDGFRPYGGTAGRTPSAFARAVAPRTVLHIISGNTPHAGLQSVIRGLLLGARNWCKIPRAGLPEIEQFARLLPPMLAARVEIAPELPEAWLSDADAVVVFGSDETIAHFRARVRPEQRFVAHGHKVSFGVVFDDPAFASVAGAARDASLFAQQGCLSPHLFYVAPAIAREYAERLATEMAAFERSSPRGPVSVEEQAAIAGVREKYTFRAAIHPGTALWTSEGSTAWTVILDPDPVFTLSCLNRTVYVKPLPEDFAGALRKVAGHLSTVGIHPATSAHAERIAPLGVSRICPIGAMQRPPLSWHQDGEPVLLPLVRWIDFEPGEPDNSVS